MPEWLDDLWDLLRGASSPRRPLFRRHMRLSGPVVEWLRSPERTDSDRWTFADLLLRLDADPFTHSSAILTPRTPRGYRWTTLEGWKVILKFDPAEDRVTVVSVTRPSA